MTKTETYRYHQNNSGGFTIDMPTLSAHEGYVMGNDAYIYALSKEASDLIAESKGIYFDGVSKNKDCPCCGDRWSRAWYPEEKEDLTELEYELHRAVRLGQRAKEARK